MKVFPTGRVGIILVVCGIAAVLGSVLNRFIDNIEDHLANQDAAPVRSTAMVRPSDLHESSVVAPAEVDFEPPTGPMVEAAPIEVAAPTEKKVEKDDRTFEPGPRWQLWFPKIVSEAKPMGGIFFGGAAVGNTEAPVSELNPVLGSLGGASEESGTFGSCTASGEGEGDLQHGVTSTSAGSSVAGAVDFELNDFRGMPSDPGSSGGPAVGGDEGPAVPLGSASYRGSYYSTEIHLGPHEETGLYEFAVLTDLNVRLETQVSATQWETLLSGEAEGVDKLLCGHRLVRFQRYTWAPMRLTVTNPERGTGQSLALLWRHVEEGTRPSEPLCGTADSPGGAAGPSTAWASFFRRGWSVVPSRSMYLPGSMESTSCAVSADYSASTPDSVVFGTAEGNVWTCTDGVIAVRVGGQLALDFGEAVCTGSDGSSGGPGMTSCWLTPPSGTDAQAFVDRVQTAESVQIRAVTGGDCVVLHQIINRCH